MNTHTEFGSFGFAASSFAAESGTAVGVASLDPPLVQQTKNEIRTLAGEIADLAHASIPANEFYDGFLPRLCVAMGASAAAVWHVRSPTEFKLLATHSLPSQLCDHDSASLSHSKILRCVIAEGTPTLVPPSTVTVDADRPSNPLNEALIVVPVRIEQRVEYVLEVVQRPSGGPAAQRGYLRFVAQMADLLADYLRRQELRELSSTKHRLERTEAWLLQIARTKPPNERARATVEALAELLDAEHAILVSVGGRGKVRAVSSVTQLDPRSAVSLAAKQLCKHISRPRANDATTAQGELTWYHATDRRTELSNQEGSSASRPSATQTCVDDLCELLRCRRLMTLALDDSRQFTIVLSFASTCVSVEQASEDWQRASVKLTRSLGSLFVATQNTRSVWLSVLPFSQTTSPSQTRWGMVQMWVARAVLLALVTVVAMFPVPQQISATAILQPETKNPYYAPLGGIVAEVFVNEGESVVVGQPLVRLVSRELENQVDLLEGQMQSNQDRIAQLVSLRNRGSDLSLRDRDRLEGELEQVEITLRSTQQQLQVLREQQQELLILAAASGTVASWDLRNRLLNRPVVAGDLLVATFAPQGNWQLQLSIPDYRAGMVAEAIDNNQQGAPLRFSLTSHPDQLCDAFVIKLASHATPHTTSNADARIVLAEAALDAAKLPMKKEGAIARATIECGQVPFLWLIVRDAYWAISSRAKMIF